MRSLFKLLVCSYVLHIRSVKSFLLQRDVLLRTRIDKLTLSAKVKPTKKRKGSSSSGTTKGFSRKPSAQGSIPTLSEPAKKLLKQNDGDQNVAQSAYFTQRIKEEHDALQSLISDEVDERYSQSIKNAERKRKLLHEAKVKAAWDTIAAFLPIDYAAQNVSNNGKQYVDPIVKRRKKMIARACFPPGRNYDTTRQIMLDVGCGDGATVPYLDNQLSSVKLNTQSHASDEKKGKNNKKQKIEPSYYKGIDVSKEMIEMAETFKPGYDFDVCNFDAMGEQDYALDVILFDGSLQFFLDTTETLTHAVKMLKPGYGRIVLCHVQGDEFVRDEVQRNSFSGACNSMPSISDLEKIAGELGCIVIEKKDLVGDNEEIMIEDQSMRSFYLVALEKQV